MKNDILEAGLLPRSAVDADLRIAIAAVEQRMKCLTDEASERVPAELRAEIWDVVSQGVSIALKELQNEIL